MGKMTRTRRALIAADMARMLRELQQASTQAPAPKSRPRPSAPGILVKGK
jgi:hypothetical protein